MDFTRIFDILSARHKEPSVIASMDDVPAKSSRRLVELAADAARLALDLELTIFDGRPSDEVRWFDTWPGEHYRLLATLVRLIKPRRVVEIGTFTGMGTLSLCQELMVGAQVTTFDLLPWDSFGATWLSADDFASGRVVQHRHDLSAPSGMDPFRTLLESAELIFIDGPKDGRTEAALLRNMDRLSLASGALIVLDDIRVMNMVDVWRSISRPKLDVTSFGHWSGTGFVDWTAPNG